MEDLKLYVAEFEIMCRGEIVEEGYYLEVAENREQAAKKIREEYKEKAGAWLDPEQGGKPGNLDFISIMEINDKLKDQKGLVSLEYLVEVVKAKDK